MFTLFLLCVSVIIYCRVESNAFVRGVDSLTLDNTAGEDGDSRDTADEDADGSVDLALNEEETRQMFHMS